MLLAMHQPRARAAPTAPRHAAPPALPPARLQTFLPPISVSGGRQGSVGLQMGRAPCLLVWMPHLLQGYEAHQGPPAGGAAALLAAAAAAGGAAAEGSGAAGGGGGGAAAGGAAAGGAAAGAGGVGAPGRSVLGAGQFVAGPRGAVLLAVAPCVEAFVRARLLRRSSSQRPLGPGG